MGMIQDGWDKLFGNTPKPGGGDKTKPKSGDPDTPDDQSDDTEGTGLSGLFGKLLALLIKFVGKILAALFPEAFSDDEKAALTDEPKT